MSSRNISKESLSPMSRSEFLSLDVRSRLEVGRGYVQRIPELYIAADCAVSPTHTPLSATESGINRLMNPYRRYETKVTSIESYTGTMNIEDDITKGLLLRNTVTRKSSYRSNTSKESTSIESLITQIISVHPRTTLEDS